MKPIFTETQRFNQWWIWLIILATSVVPFLGIYKQIIHKEPFGDNPMSNEGLIITAVIPMLFILLFLLIRLETTITQKELSFQFFPFVKRNYSFEDIETLKVINYGFVGGWGIRFTMKYGTVYNTRGNKGLFIKLKNEKTLVIGTQKPEELEKIIKQIQPQL